MRFQTFAIASFVLACGGSGSSPTCVQTAPHVVVVTVAANYSASGVGVLPLDGSPASIFHGTELGADPALATSHGRRFFVARDLDSLFELDACAQTVSQTSARVAGESQVNPQDVAVASDGALWIARLGVASLRVTSAESSALVDLSSFDTDRNPDASSVRTIGNRAFVTLDRLTSEISVQPSQMAVFDTSTFALVTTVQLAGRNPFGLMKESNGILWLADPGNFDTADETDAGIERFDTTSMTSTLVANEPDLHGSVVEVAVTSDGSCGVAIVADATTTNRTSLVSFSIANAIVSSITTILPPTDGFDLRGLFWTNGDKTLLLADTRATAAGYPVHVFTNTACALSASDDLIIEDQPALAFAE